MITIVEPKEHIDKLWGKQKIREGETYRMMRYVLRVDHEDKVLLHNVVTGRLVVLEREEAEALETLPSPYSPVMEQLVTEHYLVPEDYDEFQQVVNLRKIFQRLDRSDALTLKAISNYTILPTTACNARCYYCFEQGVPAVTMTEQIADDTVKFIADHCGKSRSVHIRWFGGEPTVASHRIDQICRGLECNGIHYSSSMTTNGYLFDERMVSRAKTRWNLESVMISVDGTEKHYNEIKAYVSIQDNPYQRVFRNVGLLLKEGIRVNLRMNFDLENYKDFPDLLSEVKERFHGNKLLQVYAFPIDGAYADSKGQVLHGSEEWLEKKVAYLNDLAVSANLFRRNKELPSLFISHCSAGSPSYMVVTASGDLGRCSGVFYKRDQIVGNVREGITRDRFCDAWRQFASPKRCIGCVFFPNCVLIKGQP